MLTHKMIKTSISLALTAVLGTGLAASGAAHAADYPERAITVIVPFPAGGGGDTLARIATDAIGRQLGQTMIVENRPGAGGNIGTSQVARAKPDGYTLGYGTNGTGAINHWLYSNPGYSNDDLEPISRLTTIAAAMVVNPDSQYKTVQELIAFGKANPDSLTCGSAGNGTTSHLACELFKQMTGVKILHIPYKGGAAAMTDLLGGRVDLLIDVLPNLSGQIAAGKLRPLAVTMNKRLDSHPDIPTMQEAGVPGYDFFAWDAIWAPKGTPPQALDRLNEAVRKAMSDPKTVEILKARGADTAPTSREELAAFVKEEYTRLGEVVKKSGARVD
ncbi:Bug family tripartite tricarboxylate transporter substrate binding protein [Alcaligenes sp. SDU_A2]|uniref:Bug family tripartite tricarboxylate transporter substrate binding protein n=1 Tax=Alcaligenes sp. SDU_A2 TaxID=3136634 RepID=UPI00311E22DF